MRHAREDYNRIQDPAELIPEAEPVFLIRGQDRAAPRVLRQYAREAQRLGASKELVRATIEQAKRMEEWQKSITSKVPDLP